jgi:hypothetical protein
VSIEDDDVERRFWTELEFRVSREMRSPNLKRLFLWCDGFIPEKYFWDETPARITGEAWIGEAQAKWKFVLWLPSGTSSRTTVDWAALLSFPEAGDWLFIAPAKKELEIKLG